MNTPTTEKVQKVIAHHGIASRRAAEGLIEQGRVKVNGKRAKLGDRMSSFDVLSVDNKPIDSQKSRTTRVLIYNKPTGELCSRNVQAQQNDTLKTVFESLPNLKSERWISIGRLDINTSGLLLFTTDGQLANQLMHPSSQTDREYSVRVFGEINNTMIDTMKKGVEIDGEIHRFNDVVINEELNDSSRDSLREGHKNNWLTVCLQSGKNREVRRLLESQGLQVNRLKRVRYGTIFLPAFLSEGRWLYLPAKDTKTLYEHCKIPCPEIYRLTPDEKSIAERQLKKMRASNAKKNSTIQKHN